MVALTIAGKTLVATARHSFWVANKRVDRCARRSRWRHASAAEWHAGRRRAGAPVHGARRARPYLTVAGAHTFYAGALPVLVHNQGCGGGAADDVILGARGTQVTSKTLLQREKYRVDVENPAPGARPGQVHLQDDAGGRYLYDFDAGAFQACRRGSQSRSARIPVSRERSRQAVVTY